MILRVKFWTRTVCQGQRLSWVAKQSNASLNFDRFSQIHSDLDHKDIANLFKACLFEKPFSRLGECRRFTTAIFGGAFFLLLW